jgi:hypothetical protein
MNANRHLAGAIINLPANAYKLTPAPLLFLPLISK